MAEIYISIGSNVERDYHLRRAHDALCQHFRALQLSSVYESEAVGFAGEPFYNLVAKAHTDQDIASVIATLKAIEAVNGRAEGAEKYAPRTLDLDLLLYDNVVCEHPVRLPREEIPLNAFVLWPLAEIAPEGVHPLLQQSYQQLWQAYDKKQQLAPIPFQF